MTARGEFSGGGVGSTVRAPTCQESKEQFAGYLMVDCDGPERAVEIAARWPEVRMGFGVLEVHPVMDDHPR
ncbi:YciI family protein [Micromonospora sp. NPDC050200]|uniref:YciI family protein n=1 Tax=Micromonospora sp. NPDC050200 TaxID=3155664 RepID=UPI0033FF0080